MKKKIITLLVVLIFPTIAYAADVKWSAVAENTTVADIDVLLLIDTGTGDSQKITVLNLFDTIDTSAELLAILTNETGTGALVFAISPTLVTPILGTITSGVGTALTALNGENIQADTIDDDSIDWADCTFADFDFETAWKMWHSDAAGDVTEITLGANGTFLESNGAAANPAFRALAAGDIPDISATYEVQLTNEAGLYAVLSDVTDFLQSADLNTFAELNTMVADKTLVNEEDAVAWDALGTFGLGVTITTGDPFTFGVNRIDNGSDLLDGEMIGADTIDNDSIDWGDMTDLTTDGALDADVVDEAHIADDGIDSEHYNDGSIDAVHLDADIIDETKIADDGIDSEHYNDGSIDLVHLASGVYAKDLVTTAPITGAADNIFVGADSDVTVAITMLKDIVTTAPLTGAEDDVLPGADADLTLAITVLKDLVTTAPVTGGTNDILTGADADITVALDFTASWDFGGAAGFELPNAAAPTTNATGEIALDTTIADHQPLHQYYDGGENMTIIAIDTAQLPAEDNEIVKYDAATDKFILEADSSGGTTAWDDIGDPDAAATVDFVTYTQTIDIGVTDDGGPKSGLILDVTGLGAGVTNVTALEITTVANDDTDYIPISIYDDSGADNDLLFQIGSSGAVTTDFLLDDNVGESPIFYLVDADEKALFMQKLDAGECVIANNEGAIQLKASNDLNDYIQISTAAGVITFETIAGNDADLNIYAAGGDISFGDDNITTTGTVASSGETLIVFRAQNNEPPATSFATFDTRNSIPVLDFDADADESAEFGGFMSRTYNDGGVTVTLGWMATDTTVTPHNCIWDVAFKSVTDDADDLDTKAYAAVNSVTDEEASASGEVSYCTIAFTHGADMDSVAAGEYFRLIVTRDADNVSDNLTDDAELLFVEIKED